MTELTAEYLREVLHYDSDTGVFTWRMRHDVDPWWNGRYAGKIAGTKNKDGYIAIAIFDKRYVAHRLAWFYQFGEWSFVDHRDGVRDNNRSGNLRKATSQQNNQNRKRTGKYLKGVWCRGRRWQAQITKDRRKYNLGYFDTEAQAHAAYVRAAKLMFGEFARAS